MPNHIQQIDSEQKKHQNHDMHWPFCPTKEKNHSFVEQPNGISWQKMHERYTTNTAKSLNKFLE